MRKRKLLIENKFLVRCPNLMKLMMLTISLVVLLSIKNNFAQQIKWLRVTDLQTPVNEIGAEYENEFPDNNTNYFSWPGQYGIEQNTMRMKAIWIGCKNFTDQREGGKLKSVKVIGSGPRNAAERENMIFEQELKLIGKDNHPTVYVDDQPASELDSYDQPDEIDPDLPCDRMVLVKFNTSMGISVTKKVMVFDGPQHGNYHVHDYVFKNTGVYNEAGDSFEQTLEDLWFYFFYRFAFAGESYSETETAWGAFCSTWGCSTINHSFEPSNPAFSDPNSPIYQMRGFYSYYGGSPDHTGVNYEEDWGCPNAEDDGRLGAWQYGGVVTLHVDSGPTDQNDNLSQPKTTWYIGSDIDIMLANVSQYDEVFMADRYAAMTEGHPPQTHEAIVGEDYPINFNDPRRQTGGGTSQGLGYGPYTLAPGDSIHIVFAEAVSGLSREKNREVGDNWLKWRSNTAQPTLIMPDGSTTSDYNNYKKVWAQTGKDSIIKTYRNAIDNFNSGYTLPKPPPPPKQFLVNSGGDRISLQWGDNATSWPNFDGYVIYRSEGTVLDPRTNYQKIFECNASNVVHSFDDITAVRGFDYYYYIQSKDNGSQSNGIPLTSSLFWTVTNTPATLQRPAVTSTLDSVRVVPNPYDIRGRFFQFGDQSPLQYDRIAFYGLPPECTLQIFTERGDLIWEKSHTNGTGDEIWNSLTTSGQVVASGIYILYVEAPDGRTVIRKFVIIR